MKWEIQFFLLLFYNQLPISPTASPGFDHDYCLPRSAIWLASLNGTALQTHQTLLESMFLIRNEVQFFWLAQNAHLYSVVNLKSYSTVLTLLLAHDCGSFKKSLVCNIRSNSKSLLPSWLCFFPSCQDFFLCWGCTTRQLGGLLAFQFWTTYKNRPSLLYNKASLGIH